MIAAGAFTLCEMALAMLIGQFAERERAEIVLFAAFRPWLLIGLALAAARWPLRRRWTLFLAALLLAGLCEALFARLLGGAWPVTESLAALLASAVLVGVLDLVAQAVLRWWPGRWAILPGAVAGILLLAIPGPLRLYSSAIMPADAPAPALRPRVQLLTGLPLLWGEGEFGTGVQQSPPAILGALERRFAIVPIDIARPDILARAELLLIAQPRPPGPAGLVAIDDWIRRGGRAVILTDPQLIWPSHHPLGDPRRPPADDGLGPLLAHWGVTLLPGRPGLETRHVTDGGRRRRVVLAGAGTFESSGGACLVERAGLTAHCRLGRGRALLIADADMVADAMWVGPGALGAARAGRIADNPAYLIDRLDRLAGRLPAGDEVRWIEQPSRIIAALISALMAPAMLTVLGLVRLRRRTTAPMMVN
jgi:hypothetical protein